MRNRWNDKKCGVWRLLCRRLKEKCIEQLKDRIPVVCMADDDKICMEELQLWDDNSFDYVDVTGFDFERLKIGRASCRIISN